MPIQELISREITGIRPFNQLKINAAIWAEAHDQHSRHRALHYAAAHRPGVVYGLEVFRAEGEERTVVIAPGVAIDSMGRTIVLPRVVKLVLAEARERYLVISFKPAKDAKSAVPAGDGEDYYRLIEASDVVDVDALPNSPCIELARIDRSKPEAPIKDPKNAFDPGKDELNLLHRPVAFPGCYADGNVGELCFMPVNNPQGWKRNRSGLWNLLREGNGRGFHLTFSGLFNLKADPTPDDPILLYVAGSEEFKMPSEDMLNGLATYLSNGGTLLAEACSNSKAFADQFQQVSKKVGGALQKLPKNSELLVSHYMFPSAPSGGQEGGELLTDLNNGIILSTFDYGGAWQGTVPKPDAADARERVRACQEFGLNVIAFAARRKRMAELSRLL
jgi:hypothetical protein